MGSIITISNQKGGVGKTTTAVNLSASIAKAGRKVLIIDSDPQGNATTGLGFGKSELKNGLYDFMLGSESVDVASIKTEMSGMFLMGATKELIGAEVEMYLEDDREFLLKNRLDEIKDLYDFIIIDCPPSLGFLTLNAITASNYVLVPLQCEYYALEGLSQLLDTLKAVKKSLNPDLKLIGILLTMYDARNNLSSQVEEEVREHFKGTVFKTVIPRNVRLSEAPSYGKPIILYDIRSKGAASYFNLAKEVIKRRVNNG
ncbi:MAG: ParA family protein [Desulfobacteraceae bacterium]|jgi:chromosome partitioning protein